MDLIFATKKLRKQMNEAKTMIRIHGPKQSKRLQIALTQL